MIVETRTELHQVPQCPTSFVFLTVKIFSWDEICSNDQVIVIFDVVERYLSCMIDSKKAITCLKLFNPDLLAKDSINSRYSCNCSMKITFSILP